MRTDKREVGGRIYKRKARVDDKQGGSQGAKKEGSKEGSQGGGWNRSWTMYFRNIKPVSLRSPHSSRS